MTRRECMCSTALHSWAKYFHTVLSGMSRFCFLKYWGGDTQAWVMGHRQDPCPVPRGSRHPARGGRGGR